METISIHVSMFLGCPTWEN